MKKLLLILPLFFLTACLPVSKPPVNNQAVINSFQDCINAGYPAMESYPRQCRTADGKHFVETLSVEDECRVAGGNWIAEFSECENVGSQWCDEKGGEWNECASACRNDPSAEVCTMQCVLVCKL